MADTQKAARELTTRQRLFIAHYLTCLNATKAAIAAGYAKASAEVTGCRMLRNVKISAEIARKNEKRLAKLEVTADNVVQEIAKLGFSNMADYIRTQPNGTACIDLSALTRDQAAALTEVETTEYTEGRGDAARDVRKVKIKLADKGANLERLGKYLKLFTERHELTGRFGAPLIQPPVTWHVVDSPMPESK